jgi:large repetitive protein
LYNPTTLATNKTLNANSTHTYNITYRVTVNFNTHTGALADCNLLNSETGTGLFNDSKLTFLAVDTFSNACTTVTPPGVSHSKVLVNPPVAIGLNRYQVNYRIDVVNSSATTGTYSLTDTPRFGYGVTIVSSGVTGQVTIPNAFVFGIGNAVTLASANTVINGNTTHSYLVSFVVDIDRAVYNNTPNNTLCTTAPGRDRVSLFNESIMNTAGSPSSRTACDNPPFEPPPGVPVNSAWMLLALIGLLLGASQLAIRRR